MWFLDGKDLICVFPGTNSEAIITADLHCADPNFSKYFIGCKKLEPLIVSGSFPLLLLKFSPNFVNGFIILYMSLFLRDSSPVIFILCFELIKAEQITHNTTNSYSVLKNSAIKPEQSKKETK